MNQPARRCMLAVFAHPDDETSAAAGTLMHYAREGVDIHAVTATRGERGDLGTGDLTIARRDLPAVREAELRAVLALYGAHPPILLDYRDQELSTADFETLIQDVLRVMVSVRPEVVITFRASGISGPEDHKTAHSRWVATRRGLHKPVSSSPPFHTGRAACTAPGFTPSVLLRGGTASRSVPSHCFSATVHARGTACACAADLWSRLPEGEGPSPAVLLLVCPAFLGSDSSAPSDSGEDIGRVVGLSLLYSPRPFAFLPRLPCSPCRTHPACGRWAGCGTPRPRLGAPPSSSRGASGGPGAPGTPRRGRRPGALLGPTPCRLHGRTAYAREVRGHVSRRALHAAGAAPGPSSAQHPLWEACCFRMTPCRSRLLTRQSGLESVAPRAQSVPASSRVLRHSSIALARRTRMEW